MQDKDTVRDPNKPLHYIEVIIIKVQDGCIRYKGKEKGKSEFDLCTIAENHKDYLIKISDSVVDVDGLLKETEDNMHLQ
jgi:hypothetical protein